MHRTQIYLTKEEVDQLSMLARHSGRKQSALIRQAIDAFIAQHNPEHKAAAREAAAGVWQHRDDIPDPTTLRKEWDRSL